MTKWCPSCEKRVSLTAQASDPDLSAEFDGDSVVVRADVLIALVCEQCGEKILQGEAYGEDSISVHPEDGPEENEELEVECENVEVAQKGNMCKFKIDYCIQLLEKLSDSCRSVEDEEWETGSLTGMIAVSEMEAAE